VGVGYVTALGALLATGLWLVAVLVVYAVASYALLFVVTPADRPASGVATDVVFAVTLPFVLAVAWLTSRRVGRPP